MAKISLYKKKKRNYFHATPFLCLRKMNQRNHASYYYCVLKPRLSTLFLSLNDMLEYLKYGVYMVMCVLWMVICLTDLFDTHCQSCTLPLQIFGVFFCGKKLHSSSFEITIWYFITLLSSCKNYVFFSI